MIVRSNPFENEDEEMNWWNQAIREKHRRPGSGVLPPLLEDMLHDPDHSLFSVKVDSPDFTSSEVVPVPNAGPSTAATADTSRSSSQPLTSRTSSRSNAGPTTAAISTSALACGESLSTRPVIMDDVLGLRATMDDGRWTMGSGP